ncbi:MAG: hypothetical protein GX883_01965 [Firmicutes bacterium]|nr:hypothetical protein [Bacillota bacterium]
MGCLLWTLLLLICWPAALLFLVLYPLIWVLLLPFRLIGCTVKFILDFVWSVVTLPLRMIKRI